MGVQIVLASHGSLAEGMQSAVKMIAGEYGNIHAFGLDTYQTPDAIDTEVEAIIENHKEDQFIILCDIKCGSVHNKLIRHCQKDNVVLISGINLVLVLSLVLVMKSELNREEVLNIVEESKENIMYFDKEIIFAENSKEEELW